MTFCVHFGPLVNFCIASNDYILVQSDYRYNLLYSSAPVRHYTVLYISRPNTDFNEVIILYLTGTNIVLRRL